MKVNWKTIVLAVVISLIPLAVFAYHYPAMPDLVATHYDFAGNADGFTPKNEMWLTLILPLVIIPVLVLAPRLDPKGKSYEKMGKFYPYFVVGMSAFMAILSTVLMINMLPGFHIPVEKVTPVAVGILFIILGNYLPKAKQNYTMGIRNPWTLHSEVVWNKTHRVGGVSFIIAGILMALCAVVPQIGMFPTMIVSILVAGGVPTVMSYVYYRQEEKVKSEE